jgi:hypothetical protein
MIIQELYYRYRLGQWVFINPTDRVLTKLVLKFLQSGIESIDYGYATITITFKSGQTMTAWNRNKYYAWLADGYITNKHGELYRWASRRPSTKVLYLLKQQIANF